MYRKPQNRYTTRDSSSDYHAKGKNNGALARDSECSEQFSYIPLDFAMD